MRRKGEREVHALLDQEHCGAFVVHPPDDGEQALDDLGREPEAELVDQHEAGTGQEHPRHCEHLLLASRERADPLIAPLGQHREQRHDLLDGRAQAGTLAPDAVAADAKVLRHRQGGEAHPSAREE